MPGLLHQIQRQRVTVMGLVEAIDGVRNGDLYKEIALLAKIQGIDVEDPDAEPAEAVAEVERRLADRGISPESAARIARVLSTANVTPADPASTTTAHGDLEPDPDFTADPDSD